MSLPKKKLLIVEVAALSYEISRSFELGINFHPGEAVFPALTCIAQASFRTGLSPAAHGMIANGHYNRRLRKVMLWEQSSALVTGSRIWRDFRYAGGRVGMLFWQQSMGEEVDILLTPAPIHKHHGGMIEDCYGQPEKLYRLFRQRLGRPFKLRHYWGPMATAKVGDWIAAATAETLSNPELSPHLCLTYLPSLDYDFQRFGPHHPKSRQAALRLQIQLHTLLTAAKENDYEVILFGDYAIAECSGQAVFPNRLLAAAGLMNTRRVGTRLYPDLHTSRAFAMTDHEVAHVYVADQSDIRSVQDILLAAEGIEKVLTGPAQAEHGLNHAGSSELIAVSQDRRWFAYPWWIDRRNAPDYARHVDIHNKPGFDPCELFFSHFPPGTGQDSSRIRGSHGKIGQGREIAIASTVPVLARSGGIIPLAEKVKDWLGNII